MRRESRLRFLPPLRSPPRQGVALLNAEETRCESEAECRTGQAAERTDPERF